MANTLLELKKVLEDERDRIVAEAKPLHEKADAIREQIAPLEAELRAVNQQIKKVEQPKLTAVSQDIAGIARALGSKTLVNNGQAETPAEPEKPAEGQ